MGAVVAISSAMEQTITSVFWVDSTLNISLGRSCDQGKNLKSRPACHACCRVHEHSSRSEIIGNGRAQPCIHLPGGLIELLHAWVVESSSMENKKQNT